MYGIQGKKKTDKRYKGFDYKNGKFVVNVIHATMWPDKNYVEELVKSMNCQNPEYIFRVVSRG